MSPNEEHKMENNDKISSQDKLNAALRKMTERTREMTEFKPGELTPEEEMLVQQGAEQAVLHTSQSHTETSSDVEPVCSVIFSG